eukprot:TRINITY_DN17086_c0_g1_i1.p1 TRINITY_DN17086_c0_g1~~TRINITY_DN17086_c0_g1_i1.p1  ORF type:complete len:391 (+),score=112.92 TRINITY_DN17086_c0_g1_i1:243-1415(+)
MAVQGQQKVFLRLLVAGIILFSMCYIFYTFGKRTGELNVLVDAPSTTTTIADNTAANTATTDGDLKAQQAILNEQKMVLEREQKVLQQQQLEQRGVVGQGQSQNPHAGAFNGAGVGKAHGPGSALGDALVGVPVNYADHSIHPTVVISWSPRVFTFPNFLSYEECDYMINIGKDKLTRSKVVGEKDSVMSSVRTSMGAWLPDRNPTLSAIQDRISAVTHTPKDNGEAFYLLHYDVGQEYKQHYDFFDPRRTLHHLKHGGQRYATFIVYLNTPPEGGETIFPKAGVKVPSIKGMGVLFFDMTPEGKFDTMSTHGGFPVLKGEKWIATRWIREDSRRIQKELVQEEQAARYAPLKKEDQMRQNQAFGKELTIPEQIKPYIPPEYNDAHQIYK